MKFFKTQIILCLQNIQNLFLLETLTKYLKFPNILWEILYILKVFFYLHLKNELDEKKVSKSFFDEIIYHLKIPINTYFRYISNDYDKLKF